MLKNVPTKTLLDAFPDWDSGGGIFSAMSELPWEEEVSADLLDLDYYGNHSGWKKCAPIIYKLFDDNFELSQEDIAKLADLVAAKFLPNWTNLWNTYHFEYDPINDYEISELGEREGTFQKSHALEHEGASERSASGSFTHGKTVSENGSSSIDEDTTLTHGEVISSESSEDKTEEFSHWGFNSSEDVPTNKMVSPTEASAETTHSGNDVTSRDTEVSDEKTTSSSGTDRTAHGEDNTEAYSDNSADAGYDNTEYSKHITGLKGIISRQDLILKERELWKDSFFDKVYADVDTVLASLIYKREHRVNPYSLFNGGYPNI